MTRQEVHEALQRLIEAANAADGPGSDLPPEWAGQNHLYGDVQAALERIAPGACDVWSRDGEWPKWGEFVPPLRVEEHPALDEIRHRARGNAFILAFRLAERAWPSVTLALGVRFGRDAPIATFLGRMLGKGVGPWWVVSTRPGGVPSDEERSAAIRLLEASALVGAGVERVVIMGNGGNYTILPSTTA